ncbi:nucleotidyltransferase family protein [Octadecabacter sp.]|nr:nucleotidyltransferase family protein [Octadecabacter sp.]
MDIDHNLFVGPHQTLREAMSKISNNSKKIVFVVDDDMVLLGSVSDGDIRRGLLADLEFDDVVKNVMNKKTHVVSDSEYKNKNYDQRATDRVTPVVDCAGRVIFILSESWEKASVTHENTVLIMAGGFGKRLKPLTDNCPKPMIEIKEKPMLLMIIEKFKLQGFKNFLISTHYLPEQIREFFKNGSWLGVNIKYIHEKTPLGTGGCLNLIPEDVHFPLLIANGDVLTDVNFGDFILHHQLNTSEATMVARRKSYTVPFGVIGLDDNSNRIKTITEKPVNEFLVNAGVYCISKTASTHIKKYASDFFDMPDFLNYLIAENQNVSVYEHTGQWEDVGTHEALTRIQNGIIE